MVAKPFYKAKSNKHILVTMTASSKAGITEGSCWSFGGQEVSLNLALGMVYTTEGEVSLLGITVIVVVILAIGVTLELLSHWGQHATARRHPRCYAWVEAVRHEFFVVGVLGFGLYVAFSSCKLENKEELKETFEGIHMLLFAWVLGYLVTVIFGTGLDFLSGDARLRELAAVAQNTKNATAAVTSGVASRGRGRSGRGRCCASLHTLLVPALVDDGILGAMTARLRAIPQLGQGFDAHRYIQSHQRGVSLMFIHRASLAFALSSPYIVLSASYGIDATVAIANVIFGIVVVAFISAHLVRLGIKHRSTQPRATAAMPGRAAGAPETALVPLPGVGVGAGGGAGADAGANPSQHSGPGGMATRRQVHKFVRLHNARVRGWRLVLSAANFLLLGMLGWVSYFVAYYFCFGMYSLPSQDGFHLLLSVSQLLVTPWAVMQVASVVALLKLWVPVIDGSILTKQLVSKRRSYSAAAASDSE